MSAERKRSLARAAGVGGAAGLLLGGVGLLLVAARTLFLGTGCADLTPAQCALETTLAREMALRQTLFGGGLALLGLSLLVLLRRHPGRTENP